MTPDHIGVRTIIPMMEVASIEIDEMRKSKVEEVVVLRIDVDGAAQRCGGEPGCAAVWFEPDRAADPRSTATEHLGCHNIRERVPGPRFTEPLRVIVERVHADAKLSVLVVPGSDGQDLAGGLDLTDDVEPAPRLRPEEVVRR